MTQGPIGPAGGEPTVPPQPEPEQHSEHEGIRFRDNRRIDPETFLPREPKTPVTPEPSVDSGLQSAGPEEDSESARRIEELTADVQRVSAEYANYRKRVERDRDLQRELTIMTVVSDLLPVLDDIGRARAHDELDGGFKAVAESVEAVCTKYGLESFGTEGEPFDPHQHEAMTSQPSDEVTEPTVAAVYQVGYRIKDRILRPARVAVADVG